MRLAIFLFITVFIFGGCQNRESEKREADIQRRIEAQAQAQVVASVNDWRITLSEFRVMLDSLGEEARAHGVDIDNPEVRRRFLDQLVHREILYRAGKLLGMDQDPQLQQMPEEAQKEAMAAMMRSMIMRNIEITEQDLKTFYQQNREVFPMPFEEVREAIRTEIDRGIFQEQIRALLEDLEGQINVEVDYELLDEI